MSAKILGRGTYGLVQSIDGKAVKQFKRTSHLIQEYAAGIYLRDCPHVVDVLDANYQNGTMSMVQFDGSLKDWLRSARSISQKKVMVKEILLGLVWLNDLGLVHGDLKPGNVVANWDNLGNLKKVVIADLGFVAPEEYSKAERTAPIYREKEVVRDFRHDIFSLGVICLECFGRIKITKQTDCNDLVEQAQKTISDASLQYLTVRMLSGTRKDRPTARYILNKMFKESPPIQYLPAWPEADRLPSTEDKNLQNFFRASEKGRVLINGHKVCIKRTRLGYNACRYYLSHHQIPSYKHDLYSAAFLVIMSSVFGESGFNPEEAAHLVHVNVEKIYKIIDTILNAPHILDFLYYTKKGCMLATSSS